MSSDRHPADALVAGHIVAAIRALIALLPILRALGRIAAVKLRVRLSNFEPDLNEVRIELNGRPLPESQLRKIDLHFRVLRSGLAGPYGYHYEFTLTPEYYPVRGDNRVKVTLVARDPKQKLPFEVYDVDCAVAYRLHRHFELEPIDY